MRIGTGLASNWTEPWCILKPWAESKELGSTSMLCFDRLLGALSTEQPNGEHSSKGNRPAAAMHGNVLQPWHVLQQMLLHAGRASLSLAALPCLSSPLPP